MDNKNVEAQKQTQGGNDVNKNIIYFGAPSTILSVGLLMRRCSTA